jgi:hypothetical protein
MDSLPPEIILIIAELLDPVSIVMLHSTSLQLNMLVVPKTKIMPPEIWVAYLISSSHKIIQESYRRNPIMRLGYEWFSHNKAIKNWIIEVMRNTVKFGSTTLHVSGSYGIKKFRCLRIKTPEYNFLIARPLEALKAKQYKSDESFFLIKFRSIIYGIRMINDKYTVNVSISRNCRNRHRRWLEYSNYTYNGELSTVITLAKSLESELVIN